MGTVSSTINHDVSLWTDYDTYLFRQGTHYRLYRKLGAHYIPEAGGCYFAVWAPNAGRVSVMGDFNGWDPRAHPLGPRWDESGVWEGFLPGLEPGALYKFHIESKGGEFSADKADPLGFWHECPPGTASRVWHPSHEWRDEKWMARRAEKNSLQAPFSCYEVHLGSWRRGPGGRLLNYRRIGELLAEYATACGFTHVELLPVMEHPFYGSWGYQTTGYFAPTARYGTPDDFAAMIDTLHRVGIGVILDWVPSHFPTDGHGLAYFDGTHLYEHADPRRGFHPDWNSAIFNYGRNEVRSFLISSALFWLDRYHADGLRVDAVASMLYLDYSRRDGEWLPNRFGGRENLEAIELLKELNRQVYANYPDVQTIAEESTAWPRVSRPVHEGGLGFGMKWNMGWMHDTLAYLSKDPIYRKHHHDQLTFSIWYAFSENFMLSLSHDEVVHCKGSLLGKMPGDEWQKRANLRLLFGYMWTHPGKKLLFMGGEFGQPGEWNHEGELDWKTAARPEHHGIATWVSVLNRLLRKFPALYREDFEPSGFEWIERQDADSSVLVYLRKAEGEVPVVVAANFTPVVRQGYRIGLPDGGPWREVANSDSVEYGGSGVLNQALLPAEPTEWQGRPFSVELTLPPLGVTLLAPQAD
ncbi:MAG: 1,4-alpha-glucan branching protein GlgB [Deltaproteobacteria bacterium]|nr:MAG: 1,4-alpha-glucan branching protein GlgB [Deltaproteobacteria bacterium]